MVQKSKENNDINKTQNQKTNYNTRNKVSPTKYESDAERPFKIRRLITEEFSRKRKLYAFNIHDSQAAVQNISNQ